MKRNDKGYNRVQGAAPAISLEMEADATVTNETTRNEWIGEKETRQNPEIHWHVQGEEEKIS